MAEFVRNQRSSHVLCNLIISAHICVCGSEREAVLHITCKSLCGSGAQADVAIFLNKRPGKLLKIFADQSQMVQGPLSVHSPGVGEP